MNFIPMPNENDNSVVLHTGKVELSRIRRRKHRGTQKFIREALRGRFLYQKLNHPRYNAAINFFSTLTERGEVHYKNIRES